MMLAFALLVTSPVAFVPQQAALPLHCNAPSTHSPTMAVTAWAQLPRGKSWEPRIKERSAASVQAVRGVLSACAAPVRMLRNRFGPKQAQAQADKPNDLPLASAAGMGLAVLGLNFGVVDLSSSFEMAAGVATAAAYAAGSDDDGLVGTSARAVGNVTKITASLARDLDNEFDLVRAQELSPRRA